MVGSDSVLIRESDGSVSLRVRVKPGSQKDRIVGAYRGALKLEVSAPPEKGKANKAVRKLLAKNFDASQSSVEIVAGDRSRDKVIQIGGLSTTEIIETLDALGIRTREAD